MGDIILLLKKDLSVEFRMKETFILFAGVSVLLCLVASFGLGSASINPAMTARIFPAVWWMIFLFSATISLGRGFDFELENSAFEGVLLSGVSPSAFYVSKVLSSFLLSLVIQTGTLILLAGLLDVPIWPYVGELFVVGAVVGLGYAALANILIALASTSRLKSFLLPLVLLPLLFPLLFAGLELAQTTMLSGALAWNSPWLTLAFVLDVLYLLLGINLYSFVIRE
jgi:heme exporter protein B